MGGIVTEEQLSEVKGRKITVKPPEYIIGTQDDLLKVGETLRGMVGEHKENEKEIKRQLRKRIEEAETLATRIQDNLRALRTIMQDLEDIVVEARMVADTPKPQEDPKAKIPKGKNGNESKVKVTPDGDEGEISAGWEEGTVTWESKVGEEIKVWNEGDPKPNPR